jgi:hypothetical protein
MGDRPMKTIRTFAFAVTMGLSIAACATVAGTAVGAGIGSISGNAGMGAAIGAGTGALIDIFGR